MTFAMPTPVKCLIVDDRDENLLVLEALLRREDLVVLTAHSGAQALDLLLAHDVALALLDVQMPEMDGFTLAELMRGSERTRHVPIIFVTAGARDERRTFRGYESGAVDFLYKPIEPHILRNKAEVFFQLYRQKQQIAHELRDRTETLRLNEMFTAVLGHDLRNPLNALLTGAQLLEHHSQDEVVRKTAARMLSSAKRMSRLIDDMLDLARARLAGGIPLKCERTDFAALVHRVILEHQAGAPDRRIEFVSNSEAIGQWDPDRLAQATSNLVGNALQHGSPDGVIEVRLESGPDGALLLSVTNEGVIAPDAVPHLFDPFRGGQHLPTRTEGLGLGLYIVQQIVQGHHGRIDLRSTDTHTTFQVTLPREGREAVKV
jgi:two-component system, sensor histidine kinase and response regulator